MAFHFYLPHNLKWAFPFLILFLSAYFIFSKSVYSLPFTKEKLYDINDPLVILNSTTFYKTVLNKDHAWIIEFYNSWCGHCKRFAPTWVDFAGDIYGWKKVVQVGVVDCSEIANTALCRDYMVEAFPTIRMYWRNLKAGDVGVDLEAARDVVSLRRQLIRFLDSNIGKYSLPGGWPSLSPISVEELPRLVKRSSGQVTKYVVVESESSYLGRELILDYSSHPGTEVYRIIYDPTNSKMAELFGNLTTLQLPRVYNLTSSGQPFQTFIDTDPQNLRHLLWPPQRHSLEARHKPEQTWTNDTHEASTTLLPITAPVSKVYMVDLENALSYMFHQEIAVHYTVKDDSLQALKDFLQVLDKYFPGRPPVKNMLSQAVQWVELQHAFQMTQMLAYLAEHTSDYAFLPPVQEWVGCKGSIVGYRGYPCSLWVLFHTLTVEAYRQSGPHHGPDTIKNMHKVLFAIRDYIKYFFSCRECARHFLKMSRGLEAELRAPNDTVLWLWWAHNKVNQRLAGDFTEDPAFPKIQFPPPSLCFNCRRTHNIFGQMNPPDHILWDLQAVLAFLYSFYSRENIDTRMGLYTREVRNLDHNARPFLLTALPDVTTQSALAEDGKVSIMQPPFRGYFNSFDISLCLILYSISAVLLVILYFVFILRRRRQHRRKSLGSSRMSLITT